MFEKCECVSCGGSIEFSLADFEPSGQVGDVRFGQSVPCPHCGKHTMLSVRRPTHNTGIRIEVIEHAGAGAVLQGLGFLFCLSIIGAVAGIPMIIYGRKKSVKCSCSKCGNPVVAQSYMCPVCKCGFVNAPKK